MAYINVKFKGVEQLKTQLDSLMRSLKRNLEDGCLESVEMVRKEANDTIAPIDTGFMVESSFSHTITVQGGVGAECIYLAPYSIWVEVVDDVSHGQEYNVKHAAEIAEGKDHPRRPEEKAHFLEITTKNNMKNIQKILQNKLNITISGI